MSTTYKTAQEILENKKKRGIREIPETLRSGTRMTKTQLRFSMTVFGVLIVALIVIMMVAGTRAVNVQTVNEVADLLRDASGAERIEAPDVVNNPAKIQFAEGVTWSGEGTRIIMTERSSMSRNYWLTLASEAEIAELEGVIGEGRFLEVEKVDDTDSIWIVMAKDDEMNKLNGLGISTLIQIGEMDGTEWLRKGTEEDFQRAEEALHKVQFLQFQAVGDSKVRLIRGTDLEIRNLNAEMKQYKQYRVYTLLLLVIALGLLVFAMKSEKVAKKPVKFRKGLLAGALVLGAVALALTIWFTVRMDGVGDQLIRNDGMLLPVDDAVIAEEDSDEDVENLLAETVASGDKFTYNYKNTEKSVSIPQDIPGMSGHRIIRYTAMALLGILVFGILFFFRHERDLGFPLFNAFILILMMIITIYPVLNTLAVSFNEGTDAVRGGIGIIPRKFSMVNYDTILDERTVRAAWVSVSKTVIITVLNLFWTGMLAYALSRREYVLRKFMTTVMVLTMYVNAGLIPNYLLIKDTLGLGHTYWVYIIPTMFSCFNMIVIRTYIAGLPDALVESARIDGAGDFRIYWRIIFPLCTPVLATVALFVAVGSWNSWFDTKLYNNNAVRDPQTLQFLLQEKIATAGQQSSNSGAATADALLAKQDQKGELAIRAAITVISTVPILVVYPILQKYFVTGMALGSVKG